MKKILFLLFLGLIILINCNQAQNYSFVYDASGNRTDRVIVLLKSAVLENVSDTAGSESKEELINDVRTVVYPNPTKDDVYVRFQNLAVDIRTELSLYDNSGRLLKTVLNPHDECSIGLSPFPVGNYYLIVYINGKASQWKIIKQ